MIPERDKTEKMERAGEKMKRNVDLREISDGRLYTAEDMVRADCHDCQGCSACCHGMGTSIILDPMDIWRLYRGTGMDFSELVSRGYVELGIADGMILPHLKMTEESDACRFLDPAGRCSVHGYRPGICRMFPLGRYYEGGGFRYFLQVHECRKNNRSKIKIKKWLGIPNIKEYEGYIRDWHDFLGQCEKGLTELDEQNARTLRIYVLRIFFQDPYEGEEKEFYHEFMARLNGTKEKLQLGR